MESAVIFPRRIMHVRARVLVAAVMALGIAASPASAEGLFDFLFGGNRRPAPSVSAYADPYASQSSPRPAEPRLESGPSVTFCVRLCDGRFFPIQRASGVNAAQACGSFCPAARTRLYSGSEINHATAGDGSRYKDLPNAFVYRERTVADCTCNGKDAYGLVTTEANEDPTLRPGDIVATDRGFVAYNGSSRRSKEFTPIASYTGLSAEMRQKLAGAKITPRDVTPRPAGAADVTGSASERRAQLDR